MKSYKSCPRIYLGTSDIASLVMSGFDKSVGHRVDVLSFALDSSYSGYLAIDYSSSLTQIPDHYHLKASYDHWLVIYDDDGKIFDFCSDGCHIDVYRAGDMGCLIHILLKSPSYTFNKKHIILSEA